MITIYHRLSAQNKYPIPLNDVCAVINYYFEHASTFQIDVGKVGIGGYSTGAFLAILICRACIQRGAIPFRQLLLVAPVTSLGDDKRPYGSGNPPPKNSDRPKEEAFFVTRPFFLSIVRDFVPMGLEAAPLQKKFIAYT